MKKIFLLIALFGCLTGFAQDKPVPSISVLGTGTVSVVPDKVIINSRIEHTGKTAAEVQRKNDKVVNEVIKYLKSQGVESKHIQTQYMRLNKEVNYQTSDTMYSANQSISIELVSLKNYEEIMSGLLNAGLNRIDGIQFKTTQQDALQSQARKKAVLNAKMKAEEYAEALGQDAGKAIHISEGQTDNYQPVYRTMEMKADSAEQSIAPGEMEITVKVNVQFELN